MTSISGSEGWMMAKEKKNVGPGRTKPGGKEPRKKDKKIKGKR
jgi:hypothetical protein